MHYGYGGFLIFSFAVGLTGTVLNSCKSTGFNDNDGTGNTIQAITMLESIPLFDVNDVSIMIPKSEVIALSEKFMTSKQFKEVIDAGEGKGPVGTDGIGFGALADQSIWKIVSLRYDPCAPGAHAAASIAAQIGSPTAEPICQNQVRLVAQPFTGITAEDFTFHLLYALPKTVEARRAQIRSLAKIKVASVAAGAPTDGVPLTTHPGLAKGAPEVQAALIEFLSLTAQAKNLVSAAVMALDSDKPQPWIFYATRNTEGKMTATPIPTIEGGGFFQSLSFLGSERVLGIPSNTPTFTFPGLPSLSREPIFDRSTAKIFADPNFSDTDITDLRNHMNRIHAIDNPKMNHFFTMDCVSCHSASSILMRRIDPSSQATEAERIELMAPHTNRCDVPKGITGYVGFFDLPIQATRSRPWTMRNFGYFAGAPVITMRTACETSEVVHDINRTILSRQTSGPNAAGKLSDSDYANAEPKIWKCIHFEPNRDFASCLAAATSASQ